MARQGVLYIATGPRKFTLEAARSARSLRARLPKVHITLFTDHLHDGFDGDYGAFSDIRVLPDLVAQSLSERADWGRNLLKRLKALRQTPYERTLHIDADTMVLDARIGEAFDMLDDHDLLLCPASTDTSRSAQMMTHPIYYCGIMGFKSGSEQFQTLLDRWIDTQEACLDARDGAPLPEEAGDLDKLPDQDRHFLLGTSQHALARHLRPGHNPLGVKVKELDATIWNHHSPFDDPGVILQANPLAKFNGLVENSYGHYHPFRATLIETFLGYNSAERAELVEIIRKYAAADSVDKSGRGGLRTKGNLFEQPDPALAEFRRRVEPHVMQAARELFMKRSNIRQNMKLSLSGWGYVLSGHGYIEPHQHTSAMLAATFYLKVPDSVAVERRGGALQLFNPSSSEGFLVRQGQMASKLEIFPQNDSFVMFPADLWHAVSPVPEGDERVALTFNVLNGT